jgi:hypothetical protein
MAREDAPRYERGWRGHGIADGAATLDDLVGRLEAAASTLRVLRDHGVWLEAPVVRDYGLLVTGDPGVAERCGLFLVEDQYPYRIRGGVWWSRVVVPAVDGHTRANPPCGDLFSAGR